MAHKTLNNALKLYCDINFRWLRNKFEAADKDNNKALNLDECLVLLRELNLKLETKHVKKLFDVSMLAMDYWKLFVLSSYEQ